jgi:hypothetical protein
MRPKENSILRVERLQEIAFALSRRDGLHHAAEDIIQILPYHPFGIIPEKNRSRVA